MTVELSVLIVNWNGRDLLSKCVESLIVSKPHVSYEIIVVDNASTDRSIESLLASGSVNCPPDVKIHVIENRTNLGFAKANNQAIKFSKAPLLFILNPDTEVKPGSVDVLIETLKSESRIGACAPRLLNPDGSLQPSVYRHPPSMLRTLVEGLKLYRVLPKKVRGEWLLHRHWDHARKRHIQSVCGAAILAKREMINDVGAFDERFHMYGEDVEWCRRIIRKGWHLVFEPGAEVVHFGGQSALQRWTHEERVMKEEEGYLRFQKLCLSPKQMLANTLARAFVLVVIRAWRRARSLPVNYFDRVIAMQLQYFMGAAQDLFMNIRRSIRGSNNV